MKYLLDTNVCIKYLNGQSDAIRQSVETKMPGEIALSSIVRAELLYGALKSSQPERNVTRLHHFFKGFPSIVFDDACSEVYATIRTQLEKQGRPIGPNDLLIASMALSNHLILVTHNTNEFGRIEGLPIEDWEI